jgi:hypothetical protein
MFDPFPLAEHRTIIPFPSQRATWPFGPSSTPKKPFARAVPKADLAVMLWASIGTASSL